MVWMGIATSATVTLFVELLTSHFSAGQTAKANSCEKARQSCEIFPTCGLQLHNAMIKCGNIYPNFNGIISPSGVTEDTFCSEECQISLLELERSTREGRDYARCVCSDGTEATFCHSQKAIFRCRREQQSPDTTNISDPWTIPSHLNTCNAARRHCENDIVCKDALHYYEAVCELHLTETPQSRCPALQCLESYEILMRQTGAQFLTNCHCDAITPQPNVIYCFKEDFFGGCTISEILDREMSLRTGSHVNSSPREPALFTVFIGFIALLVLFCLGQIRFY